MLYMYFTTVQLSWNTQNCYQLCWSDLDIFCVRSHRLRIGPRPSRSFRHGCSWQRGEQSRYFQSQLCCDWLIQSLQITWHILSLWRHESPSLATNQSREGPCRHQKDIGARQRRTRIVLCPAFFSGCVPVAVVPVSLDKPIISDHGVLSRNASSTLRLARWVFPSFFSVCRVFFFLWEFSIIS